MFDPYLERWGLEPDGEAVVTRSSRLLPVRRQNGGPAMLKVATVEEERRGAAVMVWWAGEGAAEVLAHAGPALLLARALGPGSLTRMAHNGQDDEAAQILCRTAARLHARPPATAPGSLHPLPRWFAALWPAAGRHGGVLAKAAAAARELLGAPEDVRVLHGDIHHGNVLDFGADGWRAIDPKGLLGERGYDYANIFLNPCPELATGPGRIARLSAVVADAAGLERERLLMWVLAYAGLSASWTLGDLEPPHAALAVADQAARELGL